MSGKNNQRRGKTFEQQCADRPVRLGLTLTVNHIDRLRCRGASLADLEFIDFPHFKVDCKFTINEFTWEQYQKLYREAKKKYCKKRGDKCFVIVGERKGRYKLDWNNVRVILPSRYGLSVVLYDNWLVMLEKEKTNG